MPDPKPTKTKEPLQFTPAEIDEIREESRIEGLKQGRQEILDWLEFSYVEDPGRPDRGTPKAEAILELARAAGKYIKEGGDAPRLMPA